MSQTYIDGIDDERRKVLVHVSVERDKQEAKWGVQNHDPFTYLAVLGEEVGEANQAALQAHHWIDGHKSAAWDMQKMKDTYRKELIQIAAVAVAMVECFDRQFDLYGGCTESSKESK